jgi:hypothetical protein
MALKAKKLMQDDYQPSEILNGLFLGSLGAALHKENLI